MSPILVQSSVIRIATQTLVSAKLNGRKDFILRGFICDITRPCKEQSVQSQRQCHWGRSSVFLVNFVLIIDFEEANVYSGHVEKTSTIDDKIRYIMRYVVAFQV